MTKFAKFIADATAGKFVAQFSEEEGCYPLRVIAEDGRALTIFPVENDSAFQRFTHQGDEIWDDVWDTVFVGVPPEGFVVVGKPIVLPLPERVVDMTHLEPGLYAFADEVDDLIAKHVQFLREQCRFLGGG